jgi:CubicO group peptidase (beta-lactamase class C family)
MTGAACDGTNPAELEFTPAALGALADQVARWVDDGETVGAELVMVLRGRIVFHEAWGWKDRERQVLMEPNTVFNIQSMTKPVTATAILMLVDDGLLDLDDRAAAYLPSFDNPNSDAVTIRQLLTRTAGFTQATYPADITSYATLREAVDDLGRVGPDDVPGSVFARRVGVGVLGAIVEEVTGMPVEDFITTQILVPLSMSATLTALPLYHPLRQYVSSRYYRQETGAFEKFWDSRDPEPLPFFPASGGLYSTTRDYAQFLKAWMNRGLHLDIRLLPEDLMIEALQVHPLTLSSIVPYGMLWEINLDRGALNPVAGEQFPSFGHRGIDGTMGWVVPEHELVVSYFTQSRFGTTHADIVQVVRDAIDASQN